MPTSDPSSNAPTPDLAREPGPFAGFASFVGVLSCFVLSGFAALLYQTAWMRQFSVVFGTSELAVATVLAAYMAGLALGAALAGRFAPRARRPVLAYGLLELGVALGALAVPLELRLARWLQALAIGGGDALPDAGGGAQAAFYLGAAFVVILIPTTFMGATLPLLTRHVVRRRQQIGTRVGLLYAMNTAGAVAGALAGAFVLLPRLGLGRTVLVGVGLNAVVFLLAALIARLDRGGPAALEEATGVAPDEADEPPGDARARWILLLVLVSGITSFTYEVVWTRLLAHVVGGSVQAFATMLASFLTGITLGSLVASFLARSRRASAFGFAVAQLGIAATSAWVWSRMDGMVDFQALPWEQAVLDRLAPALAALLGKELEPVALGAFLVLLPATFFIGATFPFALRTLARSRTGASRASARVYAWNTVGAIAGAVLAGFLVVPALGFAGAVRATILTNALLAAATGLLVLGGLKRVTTWLGLAGTVLVLFAFRPAEPDRLLEFSLLADPTLDPPETELLYRGIGRSATVTLLASPEFYTVRSNGLPEAEVRPEGTPPFGHDLEHLLTVLPVVARPAARSMLVIGFGGGVALERVPPSIERLDVVELEPEILVANRRISDRRAIDPLQDPRLHLVTNDARGALALTEAKWDIVVSQPSHPWTAGASHLYTREFLTQVRGHLEDDGVLVQWMQAAFLNEDLLRSLAATLLDAFPHVRLYRPSGGMLVFLASPAPLDVERAVRDSGEPFASHQDFYLDVGIACLEDVFAVLALDEPGVRALAADAPVSTDDQNLLAMRASPRSAENLTLAGLQRALFGDAQTGTPGLDPLFAPESTLVQDLGADLDRAYLARRMIYALPQRAILSTNVLTDTGEKRLAQGWAKSSLAIGDFAGGASDLQAAVALRPSDQHARYALVRDQLPGIARNDPASAAFAREAARLEGTARDVLEGYRREARGAWDELAELEPQLAAARRTEPWALDALRLRALWRVKATPPRIDEALRLCDQALTVEPDPRVLLVRLSAAEVGDRPRAVVDTLSELAKYAGERARSLPGTLGPEIESALRAWKPRLAGLSLPTPEGAHRRDQVEQLVRALVPDVAPAPPKQEAPLQEFK